MESTRYAGARADGQTVARYRATLLPTGYAERDAERYADEVDHALAVTAVVERIVQEVRP